MAEKAAHLTATSYPKTSIFEVIAQESLNSTIYPALQKFILFLSSYNPKKFKWIIDYYDELYLLINGYLQYRYINKYGASLSEYFYGLKRVPAYDSTTDKLSTAQRILSLVFLVLIPYLNNKLTEKLNIYRLELSNAENLSNRKRNIKRLICTCQAYFHLFWKFWTIWQFVKYMCNKTSIQLPVLRLLGLKLTYAGTEDSVGFWTLLFRERRLPNLNSEVLGQAASNLLEFAAFFIQFLHSWQNEFSNVQIIKLPAPDPPQYDTKSPDFRRKCPLCMQNWKIPTVVTTSGYVYCFRCIVKHLQNYEYCPVTKLPVNMSDIVRLYDR